MNEAEKNSSASSNLPTAKSSPSPELRDSAKRIVAQRGLVGLANDTKWDEFLAAMRPLALGKQKWRYSWRSKCVNGYICEWDCEWFYHLPFPLIGVEWLDVAFLEETREHRLPPRIHITDHSEWLVQTLRRINLDFMVGSQMVRIFGYGPRDLELFDVT